MVIASIDSNLPQKQQRCSVCDGDGIVVMNFWCKGFSDRTTLSNVDYKSLCPACNGTGYVVEETVT